MMHFLGKVPKSIRICFSLFMARQFGKYQYTQGGFERTMHRYEWRGDVWEFPDGPIERYK